jgi:kynurenine--oxoglutarate transaminase/cysteine-S-conjugate beta-lyase/glutamine--phenylpyruvate transaminase
LQLLPRFLYCNFLQPQEAIAIGLETEEKLLGTEQSYFHEMTTSLLKKRDFEVKILCDAGFDPVIPDGGYFIMADTSKLGNIRRKTTLSSQ